MTPLAAADRDKLLRAVMLRTIKQPSGCWEMQGHAGHSGHVQISLGSARSISRGLRSRERRPFVRSRGHVIAWLAANDAQIVPTGMVVMHTCDNPRCVNPAHLVIGTQADNIADSVAKGRFTAWHRTGRRLNGAKPNRVQPRFESDSADPQDTLRPFDEPHLTLERVPHVTVRVRGELALLRQPHSR